MIKFKKFFNVQTESASAIPPIGKKEYVAAYKAWERDAKMIGDAIAKIHPQSLERYKSHGYENPSVSLGKHLLHSIAHKDSNALEFFDSLIEHGMIPVQGSNDFLRQAIANYNTVREVEYKDRLVEAIHYAYQCPRCGHYGTILQLANNEYHCAQCKGEIRSEDIYRFDDENVDGTLEHGDESDFLEFGFTESWPAPVKCPAMRYNGEIFKGTTHLAALWQLLQKYNEPDYSKINRGWLLTDGAFVDSGEDMNDGFWRALGPEGNKSGTPITEGVMKETPRARILRTYNQAIRDLRGRNGHSADIVTEAPGYIVTYTDHGDHWYTGPGARRNKNEQIHLAVNQLFIPGKLDEAAFIADNLPSFHRIEQAIAHDIVGEVLKKSKEETARKVNEILPNPENETISFLDKLSEPQLTFAQKGKIYEIERNLKAQQDMVTAYEGFIRDCSDPQKIKDMMQSLNWYKKNVAKYQAQLNVIKAKAKLF